MEPGRDYYAPRFTMFILCTINLANLVTTYQKLLLFIMISMEILHVQLSETKENITLCTIPFHWIPKGFRIGIALDFEICHPSIVIGCNSYESGGLQRKMNHGRSMSFFVFYYRNSHKVHL